MLPLMLLLLLLPPVGDVPFQDTTNLCAHSSVIIAGIVRCLSPPPRGNVEGVTTPCTVGQHVSWFE